MTTNWRSLNWSAAPPEADVDAPNVGDIRLLEPAFVGVSIGTQHRQAFSALSHTQHKSNTPCQSTPPRAIHTIHSPIKPVLAALSSSSQSKVYQKEKLLRFFLLHEENVTHTIVIKIEFRATESKIKKKTVVFFPLLLAVSERSLTSSTAAFPETENGQKRLAVKPTPIAQKLLAP